MISSESLVALDELRQFRHVVRNIYADDLMPEKIGNLVQIVERAWPQLRAELLAFAEFLSQVADQET